jgi:hypothetical protein
LHDFDETKFFLSLVLLLFFVISIEWCPPRRKLALSRNHFQLNEQAGYNAAGRAGNITCKGNCKRCGPLSPSCGLFFQPLVAPPPPRSWSLESSPRSRDFSRLLCLLGLGVPSWPLRGPKHRHRRACLGCSPSDPPGRHRKSSQRSRWRSLNSSVSNSMVDSQHSLSPISSAMVPDSAVKALMASLLLSAHFVVAAVI